MVCRLHTDGSSMRGRGKRVWRCSHIVVAVGGLASAGCGRLSFDERPDATVRTGVDAADAAPTFTVPIDIGPHHMGDTPGAVPYAPEGSAWSGNYDLSTACSAATLELDFYGPWGPLPDPNAPVFTMNGTVLPSILPFFMNCTTAGCDDFTIDPVHVALATPTVVGTNVLALTSYPDDDYFWGAAELHCQP